MPTRFQIQAESTDHPHPKGLEVGGRVRKRWLENTVSLILGFARYRLTQAKPRGLISAQLLAIRRQVGQFLRFSWASWRPIDLSWATCQQGCRNKLEVTTTHLKTRRVLRCGVLFGNTCSETLFSETLSQIHAFSHLGLCSMQAYQNKPRPVHVNAQVSH